jgi:hypothetical protein
MDLVIRAKIAHRGSVFLDPAGHRERFPYRGAFKKITTTLGLGSALAMVRRDRVIAVDVSPDCGLLTDPNINRHADVRGHTRMVVSRLEVLASEQDPAR